MPLVLIGAAMSFYGQYQSALNQSAAEAANAKFYDAQAQYALQGEFRQSAITDQEYAARKGSQISAYGAGGADVSGSAANTVAATMADHIQELTAIQRKGQLDYQFAIGRADQAGNDSAALQSPVNPLMKTAGTVLTSAASSRMTGNPSRATTTGNYAGDAGDNNNIGWIQGGYQSGGYS